MPDKRYSPTYQDRLCWWCGSKLAKSGVKTVKDPLGHPHPTHGYTCAQTALYELTALTAQESDHPPRDWEG